MSMRVAGDELCYIEFIMHAGEGQTKGYVVRVYERILVYRRQTLFQHTVRALFLSD